MYKRQERVYAGSRSPERGWPVAGDRAVLRFFRQLIAERRGMFVTLVVLNALAAATGLVVPRLLGELVDRTIGAAGAGIATLAWLVVLVVCAQALFTFLGQVVSTRFGVSTASVFPQFQPDVLGLMRTT